MPDGEYPFGGQMNEVHGNGAALLGQPDTLAGFVTSLRLYAAGAEIKNTLQGSRCSESEIMSKKRLEAENI